MHWRFATEGYVGANTWKSRFPQKTDCWKNLSHSFIGKWGERLRRRGFHPIPRWIYTIFVSWQKLWSWIEANIPQVDSPQCATTYVGAFPGPGDFLRAVFSQKVEKLSHLSLYKFSTFSWISWISLNFRVYLVHMMVMGDIGFVVIINK